MPLRKSLCEQVAPLLKGEAALTALDHGASYDFHSHTFSDLDYVNQPQSLASQPGIE